MKIEKLSSVKSTYKVLKRKAQDDSSVVSLLESARKRLKLRRSLKKAKRRYKSLKNDSSSSEKDISVAKMEWHDLRSSFMSFPSVSLPSSPKSPPPSSTKSPGSSTL